MLKNLLIFLLIIYIIISISCGTKTYPYHETGSTSTLSVFGLFFIIIVLLVIGVLIAGVIRRNHKSKGMNKDANHGEISNIDREIQHPGSFGGRYMPIVKCVHCGKSVEPVKPGVGCVWAFLWFILGIIPGIIYIIYNRSKPPNKCPACGKNVYH